MIYQANFDSLPIRRRPMAKYYFSNIRRPIFFLYLILSSTLLLGSLKSYSQQSPPVYGLNDWMGALDGSLKISHITIPGTHDSGAQHDMAIFGADIDGTARTQSLNIPQQLEAGIRFFDIRARRVANASSDPQTTRFEIYHGLAKQYINFGWIQEQCRIFLEANPSECIVLTLKIEEETNSFIPTETIDTRKTFEQVFDSYVNLKPNLWYKENRIPTLSEVRGKIVLVRRFDAVSLPKGLDYYSSSLFKKQDNYSFARASTYPVKWTDISNYLNEARNSTALNHYYINYSSAVGMYKLWGPASVIGEIPDVPSVSNYINPLVYNFFNSSSTYGRYGSILQDFATAGTNEKIIRSNFLLKSITTVANPYGGYKYVDFAVNFATAVSGLNSANFDFTWEGGQKPEWAYAWAAANNSWIVRVKVNGNSRVGLKMINSTGMDRQAVNLPFHDNSADYYIVPAPLILSFNPQSAPVATPVTINGNYFNTANKDNNVVWFGATRANVLSATANSLIVSSPPGADFRNITVLDKTTSLSDASGSPYNITRTVPSLDFPRRSFISEAQAKAVLSNDFDNDGRPELAAIWKDNQGVTVFKSSQNAGVPVDPSKFTKVYWSALGANIISFTSADIDGDQMIDLVVTRTDNKITILRNKGNFQFDPFTFSVNTDPQSVAVADMDDDGRTDVVIANGSDNSVTLLRNSSAAGSIAFRASDRFALPVAGGERSVALADMNGDKKADIIVCNTASNGVSSVSVLLNIGEEGIAWFDAATSRTDITAGNWARGLRVADINNDGWNDIVVANGGTADISIFRNKGLGNISAANFERKNIPAGSEPRSMALGDLDGDGYPDIAVANYTGKTVTVLRNKGNGSLQESSFDKSTYNNAGTDPLGILADDLNADSQSDLVVGNFNSAAAAGASGLMILPNEPLFAPANLNATAANGKVVLKWDAGQSTSSAMAGYRIYAGTSEANLVALPGLVTGTTTYVHSGLTNGTTYYYKVAAVYSTESPRIGAVSAMPTDARPVVIYAGIASSNGNPGFARPGDRITIKFSTDTQLDLFGDSYSMLTGMQWSTIEYKGYSTDVSGVSYNYEASYVLTAADAGYDQLMFPFVISDYTSLAGNTSNVTISSTTDQSKVIVDITAPVIGNFKIRSDNNNTALAKPLDYVTLSFTASEELDLYPSGEAYRVRIGTHDVALSGGAEVTPSGTQYRYYAICQMTAADSPGPVTFSVKNYADRAGNTGTDKSEVHSSEQVIFDKKAPAINVESMTSSGTQPLLATNGDKITVFFTSDEPLNTVNVSIAGRPAVVSAAGTNRWKAEYILDELAAEGIAAYNIQIADLAGNPNGLIGARSIKIDRSPPLITVSSISSSNVKPNFARLGDIISLYFSSNEDLGQVSVAIAGKQAALTFLGARQWKAVLTADVSVPEGLVTYTINSSDPTRNSSVLIENGAVTVDFTAPVITVSDISSSNSQTSLARQGDVITLLFGANEDLDLASVTIAGRQAEVNNIGAGQWKAVLTLNGSEAEGLLPYRIEAKDPAGNSRIVTNISVIRIDLTAPLITAGSVSSSNTRADMAKSGDLITLLFASNEDLRQVLVTIARKQAVVTARGAGQWKAEYRLDGSESQGMLPYSIEAEDLAGNSRVLSQVSAIKIDLEAPVITVNSISSSNVRAAAARTGDLITLLFRTNEVLSNISVTIGGKTVSPVNLGSNQWKAEYSIDSSTPEGLLAYSITASDLAGNENVLPAISTILADNKAPVITVTSVSSSNPQGGFARPGDNITVVFGTNENTSQVAVTIAGQQAILSSTGLNQWKAVYSLNTLVPEALIAYTINATDLASNGSNISERSGILFDKTAPLVTVTSISSSNVLPGYAKAGDIITLIFSANEALSVPLITIAGMQASVENLGSNRWKAQHQVLGSELNGSAAYVIKASDMAGNSQNGNFVSNIILDTKSPQKPFIYNEGAATGLFTNNKQLTLAGTAEPGSTLTLQMNGVNSGISVKVNALGAWVIDNALVNLADGVYEITAVSKDDAGNVSEKSNIYKVTVDTGVPPMPVISRISEDTGSSGNDALTSDQTIVLYGVAEPGSTIRIFKNGVEITGISIITDQQGSWSFDYSAAVLDNNSHSFTATAIDAAGNISNRSLPFILVIDTLKPSAVFVLDRGVPEGSIQISGNTEAGTVVTITTGSTTQGPVKVTADRDGKWSYSYPSMFASGKYTIRTEAVDIAGNRSDAYETSFLIQPSLQFDAIVQKVYGDRDFMLHAESSDGSSIVFSSSDRSVATITGGNVHIAGAGKAEITATITGRNGWEGISVTRELIVGKARQYIKVTEVPVLMLNAGAAEIRAVSTSGLPIIYSVPDESVVTLLNNFVKPLNTGTATVSLKLAEDRNYTAADTTILIRVVGDGEQSIAFNKVVSPNGDGVNDDLIISGVSGYPENRLVIVNRNGAIVFEKENYSSTSGAIPWTGATGFKGLLSGEKDNLPEGTYFYLFEYKEGNSSKRKTGYFLLKY